MDATPENVEKKPDNVEGAGLGGKPEKEAENASAKGADEAYGCPKNGADLVGKENIFGLPTDEKDYKKVDDDTYKTRDGETIEVVDNEKGGSLLYGETDWETLFSWSTEERNGRDKVKAGDDSWLSNLGFNTIFGSDKEKAKVEAKPETSKPEAPAESKSLLDSLTDIEWKDVKDFFGGMFTADSDKKPEAQQGSGEKAEAAQNSIALPDGTKVATDGSWVELSAETRKLASEAGMDKPIVHKYTDKDGKDAALEIREGKVFHVAGDGTRSEVTDQRVTVTGTDGTVTTRDKQTGEVRAQNAERGISFEQGPNGFPKTVSAGGITFTHEAPDRIVVRNGDNQTQEFTPDSLNTRFREILIRQATRKQGHAQEAPPAPKESGVYETNSSGIAFRTEDGSTVAVNREKRLISIRMKEGPEVLVDSGGEVRIREAGGQPVQLDRNKLPAGLTEDAEGNICLPNGMKIGLDGKVRTKGGDVVDSSTGDVTVQDQATGRSVTISGSDNGTSTVTDSEGRKTTANENTGIVTTTTPEGDPVTYDSRTREFTVGDPSHPDFVFRPNGATTLWDGSEIGPNGEITFGNGTYIDEEGNVRFYDGTEVDADGDVHTADGKTFSIKHGAGTHHNTSGAASYADALASSIAGKSNPGPGDIAALQAALGVLGSMASALTNAGCMDAYAKVKASEGNLMQALAKAQGTGQQGGQNGPQAAQAPAANMPARTPQS